MDVIDLLDHGPLDYEHVWEMQRALHAEVVGRERADALVLVEHESVYTAGKRTAPWDRPTDGSLVVDVDRGGRITWHGPGQLVAYPIVELKAPVDVIAYVRALEQAVMDVCATYDLETMRVDDRSGVWLPPTATAIERKICAIGVRVAKSVTMHGLALNCDADLSAFERIVPCGIADASVTSLTAELGRRVTIEEVAPLLIESLDAALAPLRLNPSVPITQESL